MTVTSTSTDLSGSSSSPPSSNGHAEPALEPATVVISSIDSNSGSSSTSSLASSTFLSGDGCVPVPPSPPPPHSNCAQSLTETKCGTVNSSISDTSLSVETSSSSQYIRDPRVIPGCSRRPSSQQPVQLLPISALTAGTKLPELASVRINCKPKALQNSKITSRITILNTTGAQQAVAPVISFAVSSAKNHSFSKLRESNSLSLSASAKDLSTSVLSTTKNPRSGCTSVQSSVNSDSPHQHHHHYHYHHHHHHHLHHHHPHHTQLRHVTSSTPYSLLSANSAVSYSISEEDEDEGFNEEAASSTSSSSSSFNVDLNVSSTANTPSGPTCLTEPDHQESLVGSKSSSDSLETSHTETGLIAELQSSTEQTDDPAEDDDQLPSIAHLTVSHQHPNSNQHRELHFEPLSLSTPCCDTASSFQAMLHGSDEEDEETAATDFASSSNGQAAHQNNSNTLSSLIIKGPTGSVRGKRNIVRKSISNYTQLVKQANLEKGKQERDFCKEEKHKCVLYLTTLGIIRKTFDESKQIKAILKNSFIDYDERDVYINEEFKKELRQRMNRLPNKNSESSLVEFKVPVLFVNGYMLGGFTEIEKLNESGQLLQLLDRYRRANRLSVGIEAETDDVSISSRSSFDSGPSSSASSLRSSSTNGYHTHHHPLYQADCARCGGTRFVNCDKCFGSRKTYIHHFDYASVSLKCSHCKKTGLIRCSDCLDV